MTEFLQALDRVFVVIRQWMSKTSRRRPGSDSLIDTDVPQFVVMDHNPTFYQVWEFSAIFLVAHFYRAASLKSHLL